MQYLQNNSFFGEAINIRNAFWLITATITVSTIGYVIIEDYSVLDSFYMTIITLSTVGYSEVQPLSPSGRLFSSIMIMINIGVVAYTVSTFMDFVVNGQFFRNYNERKMRDKIHRLKDHVIICGYSKYAEESIQHFIDTDQPMVLIERDPVKIEQFVKQHPKGLYIEADASTDDVLEYVGIQKARALITAISDDSENVFITLTARQLCPTLNIVARTADSKTESKLIKAGADHILMPERIGGFYMAQLVNKPGAVEFFTMMTNTFKSDIFIEEIGYKEIKEDFRDQSLKNIALQKNTGANIIAYKDKNGHYVVNPSEDTILHQDSKLIALGTEIQIQSLRDFCGF